MDTSGCRQRLVPAGVWLVGACLVVTRCSSELPALPSAADDSTRRSPSHADRCEAGLHRSIDRRGVEKGRSQAGEAGRRTTSSCGEPISTCWDEFPMFRKPELSCRPVKKINGTNWSPTCSIIPTFAKNFATQWSVLLIGRGNQGRMVDRASLTNWLRKQFASDRPWNEVVHELVSSTGSNKENGAVNYVLAHLEFEAVPLTSRTTRLFLGQQIQCTQCHDHPSNDWKQGDFWGINAFFQGMKTEEVRKADATGLGSDRSHRVARRADRRITSASTAATAWWESRFRDSSTAGRSARAPT